MGTINYLSDELILSSYQSSRLFVEKCGRFSFNENNLTFDFTSARYTAVYMVAGTGKVYFNGKDAYINVGDMVIVPPETHVRIVSDEYALLKACFMVFGGTDVNLLLKSVGASNKGVSIINNELSETISDCFKNVFMLKDDLSGALAASGYLEIVFSELIKTGDNVKREVIEKRDERICKAVKFIDENYSKGIGVSEIAEHVELERTYFTKIFKAERGTSPQSYLVELRLNKAAELLLSGQKPDKVYNKVGYLDYQAFVRAFKSKFGVTPQKFTER